MSAGEFIGILVAGWVVFGLLVGALTNPNSDARDVFGAAILFWPLTAPIILALGFAWLFVKAGERIRGRWS